MFIAVSIFLFYIGKGHTIFIDTNAITIDDKEMSSLDSVTVSVNGVQQKPMGRAQRVRVNVSGPKHTIEIVDDANTGNIVKNTITLPTFMERVVVSIPAILGGAPSEYWVTEFMPPKVDAPVEKMQYYIPPPVVTPEETPEVVSEDTKEVEPEETPEVVSEDTKEVEPEVTPEITP